MRTDRIDFISSYCDRWCERCAFTARCAVFAADLEHAPPSGDGPEQDRAEHDATGVDGADGTATKLAWAYTIVAHRWLRAERETWGPSADPIVREAIEVISWDHILINTKLHRAFRGRERALDDEPSVQNDANGSAKVALISIERSEASWRVIAQATAGELPLMMADHLAQLRAAVEASFPDARRFIRPGFDEEGAGD